MPFPESLRLELPILLELKATGGRDAPRYIYERLPVYFPQLSAQELDYKTDSGRNRWHRVVQRAARQLMKSGEIKRHGSDWELTTKGIRRIEQEELQITVRDPALSITNRTLSHKEAQQMLVEIGQMLGRHAEAEVDHYDVVWRDSNTAPRLSHVFEVQISGSVDSALTRLKHAYDIQRSQLFLIIAGERDQRFADKRLRGSFHEILEIITVIGTGELQALHAALKSQQSLLEKLTKTN